MKIFLTKLDCAKRQLETAIDLFFRSGDPVSIHTLTRASHEILQTLCEKQGVHSSLFCDLQMIKEEYRIEVKQALNKAKNFFKHAERDPDEVIVFNPEVSEFYIWDACRMYMFLPSVGVVREMFFTTLGS